MRVSHTLQYNMLGKVTWDRPIRITAMYLDGPPVVFDGVTELHATKTGCYILDLADGRKIVLPPGYRYLVEEELPRTAEGQDH